MNIKVLTSLIALLTLTSLNMPVLAQGEITPAVTKTPETEKINNIKELLAITGTKTQFKQVMEQMIASMKSQYPQVPQEFWNTFIAEVNVDEVVNSMIPIYNKHMTNEDIKGLINFYKSPLGRRTLNVLPQITQESIQLGQQYGMESAKRALQKLEAQGYIRQ